MFVKVEFGFFGGEGVDLASFLSEKKQNCISQLFLSFFGAFAKQAAVIEVERFTVFGA